MPELPPIFVPKDLDVLALGVRDLGLGRRIFELLDKSLIHCPPGGRHAPQGLELMQFDRRDRTVDLGQLGLDGLRLALGLVFLGLLGAVIGEPFIPGVGHGFPRL
jgi:hypothetical protein